MKLAPTYYDKLDQMLTDTGQYRNLSSWRKAFKRDWKKAAATPITMPQNEKYRPDSRKWVCTCPYFSTSCFLICKHLVQLVHPVAPIFFVEVKHNQTTPFWKHKLLVPLDETETPNAGTHTSMSAMPDNSDLNQKEDPDSENNAEDSEDEIIDTEEGLIGGKTFGEQMTEHIDMLRDFANGLEYQVQFNDHRILDRLEREGGSFLRFAELPQP